MPPATPMPTPAFELAETIPANYGSNLKMLEAHSTAKTFLKIVMKIIPTPTGTPQIARQNLKTNASGSKFTKKELSIPLTRSSRLAKHNTASWPSNITTQS
jgi:hypothetical protein